MTALSFHHMDHLFERSSLEELELFHSDQADVVWRIPDSIGEGYIQAIELGHGLSLVIVNCELIQDLLEKVSLFQTSLEFEFCLTGAHSGSNFTILHLGDSKQVHLPGQQQCMWVEVFVTSPRLEGHFQYLLDQLPPRLRQISQDYFESIYDRCFGYRAPTPHLAISQVLQHPSLPLLQAAESQAIENELNVEVWHEFEQVFQGKNTPAMQTALTQILNCSYQGIMRQSYLESKALELVTLRFEQFAQACHPPTTSVPLKFADIERIYQARDILLNHLANPPSLVALARQVGINDCTLKRGFRHVFGMTAYHCLYHFRMERARQLLESGTMSVSQVAIAVGYNSRSSFYKAFRKQFGSSPKNYQ
jgi:AraC-like DNA-binding protein